MVQLVFLSFSLLESRAVRGARVPRFTNYPCGRLDLLDDGFVASFSVSQSSVWLWLDGWIDGQYIFKFISIKILVVWGGGSLSTRCPATLDHSILLDHSIQ